MNGHMYAICQTSPVPCQIRCVALCRHGPGRPTVVLPVKDLAARDLALVCHFRQLPLAPLPLLPSPGKPSLNVLADDFADAMQVARLFRHCQMLLADDTHEGAVCMCPWPAKHPLATQVTTRMNEENFKQVWACLQAGVPSAISTIVRTALKLEVTIKHFCVWHWVVCSLKL